MRDPDKDGARARAQVCSLSSLSSLSSLRPGNRPPSNRRLSNRGRSLRSTTCVGCRGWRRETELKSSVAMVMITATKRAWTRLRSQVGS